MVCDFLWRPWLRNSVLCLPVCWLVNNCIYSYCHVHTQLWCPNNKKTQLFHYVQSAAVMQKARVTRAQMPMEVDFESSPLWMFLCFMRREQPDEKSPVPLVHFNTDPENSFPEPTRHLPLWFIFFKSVWMILNLFILKLRVIRIILIIFQNQILCTWMFLMDFLAVFLPFFVNYFLNSYIENILLTVFSPLLTFSNCWVVQLSS